MNVRNGSGIIRFILSGWPVDNDGVFTRDDDDNEWVGDDETMGGGKIAKLKN